MIVCAKINKETLLFIREQKKISSDYVERVAKFDKTKLQLWEDIESEKFPTINQAKTLAKCYHVPFAGLYMDASDIPAKRLPPMRNLRTVQMADVDDTALNLAILDLMDARELLIDSRNELGEEIPTFDLSYELNDDPHHWARYIRKAIGLTPEVQYKCKSARQLYLFIRERIEECGIFVHCFTGIPTDEVRGFAVYDEIMPIIGINAEDRYPAKSFSIIHELVHIMKRSTAICNDMNNSFSGYQEEIFCNAVAGAVLVPFENFSIQFEHAAKNGVDLVTIDALAKKFSVSREVIIRRMLDYGKITKQAYEQFADVIRHQFEIERDNAKLERKISGQSIPRNIPREATDRTSSLLCKTFLQGYQRGFFDKQDVSRYLGIKQKHIGGFMMEVAKW